MGRDGKIKKSVENITLYKYFTFFSEVKHNFGGYIVYWWLHSPPFELHNEIVCILKMCIPSAKAPPITGIFIY